MMTIGQNELLAAFESGDIEPATFDHRQHVQAAFEMLQICDYAEACSRYTTAIIALATRAGARDKFNVTITFAFLSLIAERMHKRSSWADFEEFLAGNEDLLSNRALHPWYSKEELHSDYARRHFLLPRWTGTNRGQEASARSECRAQRNATG